MPTTGSVPLQQVIPGQLIASSLWNNEFGNIGSLLDPVGCGSYSTTDQQMQIQTNPYPGSVTSHASSLGGELERIRFVISQMIGSTYWYQPANNGNTLNNVFITGEIRSMAASMTLTGFLLCDGSAVSRTTYAALFTAIGTIWGSGDGSTTFNVPDLRGRCLIGSGQGSGLTNRTAGTAGGEETHLLTTTEMPTHNHTATSTVTDPGHVHSISAGNFAPAIAPCLVSETVSSSANTGSSTTGITVATSIANAGSGGAHNNMQPWAVVVYYIKT